MYAWIWRKLPGPTPARVLLATLLFALVVWLLFAFVFPWLEPLSPFGGGGSVDQGVGRASALGVRP